MSDFIDDPATPDPGASPEALEPLRPSEAAEPPVPTRSQSPFETDPLATTASVFTSGFESPGESVASQPTDQTPTAPVETASPFALEMSPLPTESTESSDPFEAPAAPYRPSPPIERAVRPLEPYRTEPPNAMADLPRREPTRPYYAAKPTEEKSPRPWPMALLAVASGLLGALLVVAGLAVGGVFDEAPIPSTTTAPPAAAVTAPPQTVIVREVIAPEGAEGVATAVGQKVVPSIVTVEVGTGDAVTDFAAFGSGSGVVFTADGLILTNHHVVDGAETTRVIFQDGRIYEATIIGSDELTDLAVLEIPATGLIPVELGSTGGLQIGDRAIAVGNPLGLEGGASLTVGVVSAFDREVNTGDATPLFGMLQTDAPITNGSSGGALVDGEGKLIGITTAIGVSESGAEGIGFATPVEVVRRIADQIIATGEVAHAFLGVSLRTNFVIQSDGAAVPTGAIVAGFADSPSAAEDAGLEIDDVIVEWNGNEVRTINDLINGIRASAVGEEIQLVIDRDGETFNFSVVLGQRPEGV